VDLKTLKILFSLSVLLGEISKSLRKLYEFLRNLYEFEGHLMKILTHTSIGLFAGVILYYFLDLDISFILLAGFAAFIPDIDWRMQFSWKMGNVHRKVLHNIWVLAALIILVYFVFKNLLMVSAVALGFLTHLIADSFTVTGVYWLYPLGRQNERFHVKGPFSMSTKKADKIEAFLQTIFFTCSGFIFLQKTWQ